MSTIILPFGLILLLIVLVLSILLLNQYRYQRVRLLAERMRALGLPEGNLIYEDADGQGALLSSSLYPLVGKPDYIVQLANGRPVPIELKLNVHNISEPYSNHVMQVAAYCLILEDHFEQPPTYGMLRYADGEYTIEYTPALRKKVIRLLTEMAQCSEQAPPTLKKQRVAKCRACAFQPICQVGREK